MTRIITYDGITGALIDDYDDGLPDPVPATVSARQIKLALLAADLLDDVEAFAASQDRAVQISWEYAVEFERQDPMLTAMAAAFGLTDEQVDDLFRAAAEL